MRQIYNSDVSPCSPLPPSPPPPPATTERPGREEEVQTCIPGCNQAKLSLSQLLPTRLLNSRMSVSGSHLPLLLCSQCTFLLSCLKFLCSFLLFLYSLSFYALCSFNIHLLIIPPLFLTHCSCSLSIISPFLPYSQYHLLVFFHFLYFISSFFFRLVFLLFLSVSLTFFYPFFSFVFSLSLIHFSLPHFHFFY